MSYGKPHMPMFDGRDDVHSFLDKLEIYFNYSGVMDKDKRANVLMLQCVGEAGQHIVAVHKADASSSYDTLKQSLLTRYGGQTHSWQSKLWELHQDEMESVTQFAATFRNHILRSGAAAGEEAIKINMFIRALYDRGC